MAFNVLKSLWRAVAQQHESIVATKAVGAAAVAPTAPAPQRDLLTAMAAIINLSTAAPVQRRHARPLAAQLASQARLNRPQKSNQKSKALQSKNKPKVSPPKRQVSLVTITRTQTPQRFADNVVVFTPRQKRPTTAARNNRRAA